MINPNSVNKKRVFPIRIQATYRNLATVAEFAINNVIALPLRVFEFHRHSSPNTAAVP